MTGSVVHLTASRSYGGPERQILGLADALADAYRSTFVSFAEGGHCADFLQAVGNHGFPAIELQYDTPRLLAARREIVRRLRDAGADLLCCHGYKADLAGGGAARCLGIPVVAVSHGWTGESLRIRAYEALDRWALRRADHVVAVSRSQANSLRAAGVDERRITVIPNAVRANRFGPRDPEYGERLRALLDGNPTHIVGAAGRLSPEKGFDVLIDAAAEIVTARPGTAFVLFGDGRLDDDLKRRVRKRGLESAFSFAGFEPHLRDYLPHLDVFALSSFTEGLPVILLEAMAASVPVAAAAVGGVPEVVEDGITGRLVAPHDAAALGRAILDLLADDRARRAMGDRGRQLVLDEYDVDTQARGYAAVFAEVLSSPRPRPRASRT